MFPLIILQGAVKMRKYFHRMIFGSLLLTSFFLFCQGTANAFQVKEGRANLSVILRLPNGYEFIKDAPYSLAWHTSSAEIVELPKTLPKRFDPLSDPYKIPLITRPGTAIILLRTKVYYCEQSSKMCFQETLEIRIPFVVAAKGSSTAQLIWNITPQKQI